MRLTNIRAFAPIAVAAVAASLSVVRAADIKVDLSREIVGKTPVVFEPMMGMWVVAQDGPDKVIKVDGQAFKAALDTPTRLALENARKMYGTSNEELMDNAKQFTTYPIAVLKTVDNFTNGTISVKFKTVSGDADRCSGILFNVKPNGDWLTVRYNDTEHNVILWEFHHGTRRPLIRPQDGTLLTGANDRAKWHDLKLTVDGANIQVDLDGTTQLKYVLGSAPGPGRNGAPPNADLIPANNPVIQPPVSGKVGLWSKTDSTSLFKDYVVSPK